MELKFNTSVKNIEAANCVLGQAIKELTRNKEWRESLGLTASDITNAKKFNKKFINAHLKK